jgi:hypothetical protein
MSRFQRLVDGWNTYQAQRIYRRGMRKCLAALADDSPVTEAERRRHDEMVAAEMERALAKRIAG